ncbi:unnamed protein product [Prorocentrum cordatum]|uniref:Tc1-like transposase DDE domain-containing protein n=1 Tax=Prorocentrum cordatum TaxID=2364126 RepID=A0ABN9WZ01_9DINO|nr:unnamed protein product [Polarella glacialis]
MGGAQAAKRALVKVILALALTHGVQVSINRDSPDPAILSALRRVDSKDYRKQSQGVMVTILGFTDHAQWLRFVAARVTREREIAERTKRIRSNPDLHKPYPPVPAAQEWLSRFAVDRLRYPILVVIGPSMSGKTEWAQSLFACPLECKIGRRRLGLASAPRRELDLSRALRPGRQVVHPKSLDTRNATRVLALRDGKGLAFTDIADRVWNVSGERPTPRTRANTYWGLKSTRRRQAPRYDKCGRKPWKLTEDVTKHILKRMVALRKKGPCTASTLQQDVAAAKGVDLDLSLIRRTLREAGYRWLPRMKRRVYTREEKEERAAFCKSVVDTTEAQLTARLCMSLDGVVLTMPPSKESDRMVFLRNGEHMIWRKPDEDAVESTAGKTSYDHQVPLSRAVPMWGGVGKEGAAAVLFHDNKKVTKEEWAEAVASGDFQAAVKATSGKARGPWTVLCDNERFLSSKLCEAAHKKAKVSTWHVPARSPDLNPVERYWSWLRRRLRALDLMDAKAKKPVMSKVQYKARVRRVMNTARSKTVAGNIDRGFRKTRREIHALGGGAARRG